MNHLRTRLCALLLCSMVLLSSCANLNTLKYQNEEYHDTKNNIIYRQAPICYEAVSIVKNDGVAKIQNVGPADVVLYQIEGVETSKMLSNEQYEIFYASSTTLPELWEMNSREVYICQTVTLSAQIGSVSSPDDVAALIECYRNGAAFPVRHVEKENAKTYYYLKFVSDLYPFMYYTLEYMEFAEEVVLYEVIERMEDFVPKYAGVEVTFEDYVYNEGGVEKVEKLAVYHFGTNILYDRTAGTCYAVSDLVSRYMSDPQS